jgi:heme A synthase
MYTTIKILHSYWAYLVVLVVFLATINALYKYFTNKPYDAKDFRISLFALIVSHIQLLIGILVYILSPYTKQISELGMGEVMKDANLRLYVIEHPITMILTIVFITIGYSKHKKKAVSKPKFKLLSIFYTIAFVLLISRIPWKAWLGI